MTTHTQKLVLPAFAVIASLTGCASAPPMFLYEGPQRAPSEVAQIRVSDSMDYSGNRLSYDWISNVISVNEKPTRDAGRVHVLPGKYIITMVCYPNPKYTNFQKSTTVKVELNALAGQTYYPWCRKSVGAVAVTGGQVSHGGQSGQFVPYLSINPVP